MTQTNEDAPDLIKQTEMRRDWWIHYKWENVTSHSDSEPVYLKAGLRPIEETVIAAEQFDTAWRNSLGIRD